MRATSFFAVLAGALLSGLVAIGSAQARQSVDPAPPAPHEHGIRLAQSGDIAIYIDRYGREVLVDRRTGQVVGIRPGGRSGDRDFQPQVQRRPTLSERLRRQLEATLGLREPPPGNEVFTQPPERPRGNGQLNQFPAPPPPPQWQQQPSPLQPPQQTLQQQQPLPPLQSQPLQPSQPTLQSDQGGQAGYPAPGQVESQPLPAPGKPSVTTPPGSSGAGGSMALGTDNSPLDQGNLGRHGAIDQGNLGNQENQGVQGDNNSFAALPDNGNAAPDVTTAPKPIMPNVKAAPPAFAPGSNQDVAKIQILLDRLGLSPGVIDGQMGDNVNKALNAYKEKMGRNLHTYDKDAINKALAETGGPAFVSYTITPADVATPFVASIPTDYAKKAKLERLDYTSVTEMLAERFHMDEDYLKKLNPGVNFNRPGTVINVAAPGAPATVPVARIIADKATKQVRGYDAAGHLVVAYPATIGSTDTPSPSGTVTVERVAQDPVYTYNPKINFKQGSNDTVLKIPPGPNGPVGSVWIALSKPTYGIHGTPEPSLIGKTASHGCVRLTNWDAEELASLVKPGVTVEFTN